MLESANMRFVSEHTLLVEFGETLNDAIHQKVLKLDSALMDSSIGQLIETLPTFRSLTIEFDPFSISHESLIEKVMELDDTHVSLHGKTWCVPVCFDTPYSEDLDETAKQLGMSQQKIIATLITSPLKVYMVGFVPGFAYLGGLDNSLSIPRRKTPRLPVAPGSLIIAGGLAGFMPIAMPTGWYVLGQTPVSLFSDTRSPMVPFAVGDFLQLVRVDKTEFLRMQSANQELDLLKTEHMPDE